MAKKVNLTSMYAGVGKTSLNVLMARDLESEGANVLIIDNSYKASRLPGMFGLPRVDRTLEEIIPLARMNNFTYDVMQQYVNHVSDNINVIGCSRKNLMDPITLARIIDMADFYGDYDYILVETPVRFMITTIPNIIVVDGRIVDYKNIVDSGQHAIINKFDPASGLSTKKLGKDIIAFPYEPTMCSYELMGKFKFSDLFYDELYKLLMFVDKLNEEMPKEKVPASNKDRAGSKRMEIVG